MTKFCCISQHHFIMKLLVINLNLKFFSIHMLYFASTCKLNSCYSFQAQLIFTSFHSSPVAFHASSFHSNILYKSIGKVLTSFVNIFFFFQNQCIVIIILNLNIMIFKNGWINSYFMFCISFINLIDDLLIDDLIV